MALDPHTLVAIGDRIYQLASLRHRIGARAIDVGLLMTVSSLVAAPFFSMLPPGWEPGAWVFATVLGVLYLLLGDTWLKGASLGKRLAGLRVIRLDSGLPPSVKESLLRSVDSSRLLTVPGLLFAALEGSDSAVAGRFAVVYAKPYDPPVPLNPEVFGPPPGSVNFDDLGDFLAKKFRSKPGGPEA